MNQINIRIANLAIMLLLAVSPLIGESAHSMAAKANVAPCDPFSEIVFNNDICYGEPDNFTRRLKLGPASVPGAGETVSWEVVSFEPAPGSDMSAFVGGSFTTADNSTTNTEFRLFNDGQTFRPEASPVGVNGQPLFGTYTLSVVISNTATGCNSDPYVVTKTITGNPQAPSTVVANLPYCYGEPDNFTRRLKIGPDGLLGENERFVWEVTNFIPGPGSDQSAFVGSDLYSQSTNGTTNSEFLILTNGQLFRPQADAVGVNGMPIYGTYELTVYTENTVAGCLSEGFSVSREIGTPAEALDVSPITMEFCSGASFSERSLQLPMGIVSSDEVVVWVVQSAPAASGYAPGLEFAPCEADAEDNFFRALASNRRTLAAKNTAPAGTYVFKVKRRNCSGLCDSPLSEELFTIIKYDNPTVEIVTDTQTDNGNDICLGTTGVSYEAVVTPDLASSQTFAWCAYNSGDGSGNCFNGFSDNTAQTTTRDWTSSTGSKSVGVTVTTDVPGCNVATDLLSFMVDDTPEIICPDDVTATLITDPNTFNCQADASWTHPMIDAGGCGPATLTISIDGAAPQEVEPGASFTTSFFDLGEYDVSYTLTDVLGGMTQCSFTVTVDGLPCGWVNEGGLGCEDDTNNAMYDAMSGSYMLTSNNCTPEFPYTEDHVALIYTEMCGDGEIVAEVTAVDKGGFAGVMIRDFMVPFSPMVALGTNRVSHLRKEVRVLPSYPAFPQELLSFDKFWIKIERDGNLFKAYASTDGSNWIPYIFQTVNFFNECATVGLYTFNQIPGESVSATFANVSVNSTTGLQGQPVALANTNVKVNTDFVVYPNPTDDLLNVNLQNIEAEQAQLRLFNSVGQLVKQIQLNTLESTTTQINVADLEAGFYTLSVQINGKPMSKRIVIAR